MEQTNAVKFIEENLKTIYAYALSRVSNQNDAEDLTNDIVLAILQSADKIRNPQAFYGYVWGIAANTYRKFMRKANRVFEEIDDNLSDESDFTDELFLGEDIRRLRREIALLSKEYRECTIAYYYDELSCLEISEKYQLSPEMVKYYLFKTRKILKEGICMEREFGEKSFKPAPFQLHTIYSGRFNREYKNLFSRKLPGQILLSAYYTPMTIREFAVELGVASVYLEDEIRMLGNYGLMKELSNGRYQSNLVIFTADFSDAFQRTAEKILLPALSEMTADVKGKLAQVRELNGICGGLSDERLLWGLLWPLIRWGEKEFSDRYCFKEDKLYDDAEGVNYGSSTDEHAGELGCHAFASYAQIDENYYAVAADFGVLPERNRYQNTDREAFREKVYKTVSAESKPEFMILTEEEEKALREIVSQEAHGMAELYERLFSCACEIMRGHAPKHMREQTDGIVFHTLLFRTVGLVGYCAVKCGGLAVPDFDGPAALYVRKK